MRNKQLLYDYISRTELGEKLVQYPQITTSQLWFLVPNNVKRRLGIPVTRVAKRGRKTRKYKQLRKRIVLSQLLFDILCKMIESNLTYDYQQNFFQSFVEIHSFDEDGNLVRPHLTVDYTIPRRAQTILLDKLHEN